MSKPTIRTSAGLRDAIFDEIDDIRAGNSNPTRANAVAKLAAGIVETVRMELEVHRQFNKSSTQSGIMSNEEQISLSKPLELGTNAKP